MKLEYRDLSSSRAERLGSQIRSLGFLDFFAASLLIFFVSLYLVMPVRFERAVDLIAYEPVNNSYASLRCIQEHTTRYQFTKSRGLAELKDSVRVIHQSDLDRYAKPQPDAGCYAAGGFTEPVTRWEFFTGWIARRLS